MTFSFSVENPNGQKYNKTIEEITTDQEASTKKLILTKEGPDFMTCFMEAINGYLTLDDFANDVNFYRKFVPKEQFAGKYPTIVEFYQ